MTVLCVEMGTQTFDAIKVREIASLWQRTVHAFWHRYIWYSAVSVVCFTYKSKSYDSLLLFVHRTYS